ncbi:hybrid sensor histidine kinase/response regulator [Deltaproteobacteria bacterium TL4]
MKNACILTVDDNPTNLQVLGNILSEEGYDVVVAQNGTQAIKSLNTVLPDLILLDIMMPEMDGFETYVKLKVLPQAKNIPVIFLTAKADSNTLVKAFELGAVDYITKPFNSRELLVRVNTHLQLKFSRETVLKQNYELNELIHVLCHDLSNPLLSIIFSLEAAKSKPNYMDPMRIERMLSCAKQQAALIQQVRQLRAITEGKYEIVLKSVNLKTAIEDSLKILEHQFIEKDIEPVLTVEKDYFIFAESVSLVHSVLNNILTNALKFSHPGSEVMITVYDIGRTTALSVKDHGIGIPEDLLDKIFDVNKVTTRFGTNDEKGSGFGMPLVHKFMLLYEGKIEISSREERQDADDYGTNVILTFKTATSQAL